MDLAVADTSGAVMLPGNGDGTFGSPIEPVDHVQRADGGGGFQRGWNTGSGRGRPYSSGQRRWHVRGDGGKPVGLFYGGGGFRWRR